MTFPELSDKIFIPTRPRATFAESIRPRILDCSDASVCTYFAGVGEGVAGGVTAGSGEGLTITRGLGGVGVTFG